MFSAKSAAENSERIVGHDRRRRTSTDRVPMRADLGQARNELLGAPLALVVKPDFLLGGRDE